MLAQVLILLALLALNGLFAMAELGIVSSRRIRLKQMADKGSKGARAALRLLDEPTRFLSTVQIGITLIGVLAGVYSGANFAGPLEAWLGTLPLLGPIFEDDSGRVDIRLVISWNSTRCVGSDLFAITSAT